MDLHSQFGRGAGRNSYDLSLLDFVTCVDLVSHPLAMEKYFSNDPPSKRKPLCHLNMYCHRHTILFLLIIVSWIKKLMICTLMRLLSICLLFAILIHFELVVDLIIIGLEVFSLYIKVEGNRHQG